MAKKIPETIGRKKKDEKYAKGGEVGSKHKIGDLVFAKDEGQNGLVGLIVSDAKGDDKVEYDVLFRGYNGDILSVSGSDITDIRNGYLDVAQNKSDISAYKSISKKRGIELNPIYEELINDSDDKYAKGGGVGKTKKDYVEYLNEIGVPEHDHPENDGRVTWSYINRYGEWLKKNDPIAFEVGYSEWKNEYAKGGSVPSGSNKILKTIFGI